MDRSLKIFWKVLCCSGTAVWQLSFEVKSRRDYSPATSVAGDQKKFFGIRLFFPLLETRGAAFLVATSTSFCISAVGAALTRVLCADWSSVYMGIRRDNRIDICDEFLLASWPCKKWLCPISRCGLITAPPAAQTWLWCQPSSPWSPLRLGASAVDVKILPEKDLRMLPWDGTPAWAVKLGIKNLCKTVDFRSIQVYIYIYNIGISLKRGDKQM